MRGKNLVKNQGGRKYKIKVRYLVVAVGLMLPGLMLRQVVQAVGCPDVRVVFARGSGGERWNTDDYLTFKSVIEDKLITTSLNYEFVDLNYPAVGVSDLGVLAGAYFGAGDAYEFGASMNAGVRSLTDLVNGTSCPGTKYVMGGYSQGAMVVSKALSSLNADRVIYAATFGDPKIYLPEGEGLLPAACRGKNLSDYRAYVPDCQAYKGMLGAYIPYEPLALAGKVGTWCNGRDIFCSSHLSISDHVSYVADDLYEDASRVIYDKICQAFGVENTVSSPHDTAILIDSTGSMAGMISKYKAEALRLARETLESGGRVALYDYRDLNDPYSPVQRCDFNTCTLESFQAGLDEVRVNGGGDTPESLLSASFHVMKDLEWKHGATKSLVVLTDANFLSPDRDGMTFDEVVALSKKIDPVNFYIITKSSREGDYTELAVATDGKVVTNFDELSLLTDYIMERYDSLPRVEEGEVVGVLPVVEIIETEWRSATEVAVKYKLGDEANRVLVALNNAVLGITEETEIVLSGLDTSTENTLRLVPLSDDRRGEGVEILLDNSGFSGEIDGGVGGKGRLDGNNELLIPKAPNTGKS
ncbi:cutinase family protein [Candidatus Saccharibacteria bacterium]|nr:cutinase family protein [Candidatus Saccharibacteria bacterium]